MGLWHKKHSLKENMQGYSLESISAILSVGTLDLRLLSIEETGTPLSRANSSIVRA